MNQTSEIMTVIRRHDIHKNDTRPAYMQKWVLTDLIVIGFIIYLVSVLIYYSADCYFLY